MSQKPSIIGAGHSQGRRSFLTTGLALSPLLLLGNQQHADAADPRASRSEKSVFVSIRAHENDHVTFLTTALGSAARPKPVFQGLVQKRFKDFIAIAQALENTGVGAYLGAAPVINNADLLAAAGSILTIEARHAGAVNFIQGDPVSVDNDSFDQALSPAQVTAAAGGFIASLNGGPPLGYSDIPSDENDIAILNFALALEYLEAEFYNVNAKFFS